MKRQIYTDTSVLGGCFDAMFEEASQQLFARFREGRDLIVVSTLTLQELNCAPAHVRELLKDIPKGNKIEIEFSEEAAQLAQRYISGNVIRASSRIDAQHIACATVHKIDVLVSWNFKHIVNLKRIHGYNSINLREGYPLLEIRTPQEVLDDDDGS